MPEPISTTSAALLGQLAWREQTPYELTKAMARNVRFIWPRADSHVYREVKRLVELGLAVAEPDASGRRQRTLYRITEAGQDRLAEWLAARPGGFALQHEPLLRVLVASAGTREDLLAAVGRAREDAEAMLAIGRPLGEEYLARRHEMQHEVHLRALTFDFLFRFAQLTVEWAERTEAEVATWRDLAPRPAKERRALARIRALLRGAT